MLISKPVTSLYCIVCVPTPIIRCSVSESCVNTSLILFIYCLLCVVAKGRRKLIPALQRYANEWGRVWKYRKTVFESFLGKAKSCTKTSTSCTNYYAINGVINNSVGAGEVSL